jgi:hypothetical protein
MDEVPEVIAAGLAAMAVVGTAGASLNWVPPPHPTNSMSREQGIAMKGILLNDRLVSEFVTASSFLSLTGTCRLGELL